MYHQNNRQYIFKQVSGKMWNFFHDEKLGLCYSTLTGKNTWTTPVSLNQNIQAPFYADMDSEDFFHILLQDKDGNIHYTFISSGSLNSIEILSSKSPTAYDKHLCLVPLKNNVHFFYVLQHNDSTILAHQMLTEGKISTPKVIDYVIRNDRPYSVAYDRSGNIYVFYQSNDGKFLQLGYKRYIPAQKFWGEFTPLTRHTGDCEYPHTVADAKNVLHICYQRQSSKQYELIYQQKVPDKNLWTAETVVYTSPQPLKDYHVLCVGDSIIVFWIREDAVFYSSSEDGGSTWSKPSRYNFMVGRQLFCMSYKTNSPNESDRIAVKDIPGSFMNGIKLAFYNNVSESMDHMSPGDLKNLIVDSLKLLKGNVEDLKDSEEKLRETLSSISLEQQSMDKEMTKLSVKLDLLENQLKQLGNMRRELNDLSVRLEQLEKK